MAEYADISIKELKGVGDKTATLFHKLNIFSVGDLIGYYPRDYDIFKPVCRIAEASLEVVSIKCVVQGAPALRYVRGRPLLSFQGADETGTVFFTYFNAPYLAKTIKEKHTYIFRGFLQKNGSRLSMVQPRLFSKEDYELLAGTMQPRYPLTKGITNRTIINCVHQALESGYRTKESLPENILAKEKFLPLKQALYSIHFPKDTYTFLEARRRLAFEEFFDFILKLKRLKLRQEKVQSSYRMIEVADTKRLIEALPYRLTEAQKSAWASVEKDLAGEYVSNRLIQGDVGSGKTIIALLALIMCAANGYQGAIMAPTSVLARQHYEGFAEMTRKYALPIKPVLLTGALSPKEKREAQALIASGERNVIVGTQALFQEKVSFKNLALVITDEQHRFGVRQRDALSEKGSGASGVHVLAMSATPIPRTLAIILYGDLEVSLIDQMPGERKAIKNAVIDPSFRGKAIAKIIEEIRAGHQAYVICPMIEPGEMEGVQNVTEYADELRHMLPQDIRVGLLHGKMRSQEKDRVMEEYAAGNIDVLVSTTVVEVGVNVPNATVMMIEDAQRFGLAQLHQLRGRVGRGDAQSYCLFVDTTPGKPPGEEGKRLTIMKNSNNGFEIAEEDLRQRGPGELFGIRQSGELAFRVGDIYRDAELLTKAAAYAEEMLREENQTKRTS